MLDYSQKEQERKQFVGFMLFFFIFFTFVLFFLIKDKIGLFLFKLAYYDVLIGEKLYGLFGFFKETPVLKQILYKAVDIEFQWGSLSYITVLEDGRGYKIFPYVYKYYWPVNVFFAGILTGVEYFILSKLSRLSSKFVYNGIKNKRISLYFNDKILQNFKRKTIEIWDTVGQKNVKQFVFNDYFPPYFPQEESWFSNYIENSIYYSMHPINLSEERYEKISKISA